MANQLIRLDEKYISAVQLQMAEDRILETYINNLSEGAPDAIYGHLQDAGFLYVARMLGGTKLDPTLISALVERWRPEAHTFHLPCGECTITLEDVSLQLGLPVDGEVVMGPVLSADWSATCEQLLGKVPNKFKGSRIEMRWLEDNFKTIEASASDVEKEQFVRAFILKLIGGLLMPDKSRNLVHLRWLLLLANLKEAGRLSWGSAVLATLYREMCRATQPEKAKIGGCMLLLQSWAWYRLPFLRPQVDLPYEFPLVIWWNNPARHSGIPTELEDIRLALDQQTEEEFVWMPYANPRIQECIPVEFLANRNIWYVKVPLIVFATVEIHESNRVMRQFGCMQRIPSSPQKLDDLHNIDLRGRLEEDWSTFHQKYIDIWQRRYDYLPTREPFLTPELATSPDYMDWFRHNGKPYLLSALERSRQRRRRRQRQGPIILGQENMSRGDQHLLQLHTNTRLSCNHLVSMVHIFFVLTQFILHKHHTIIHCINAFSRCIFPTIATHHTILRADATSNIDVSGIVDNSHLLSTVGLCNTIQLSSDSVANTPNNVFLPRWVILATADSYRGGCTMGD
ncbi:hypothetical protein J1N35_003904 [Gossypium stocksii]|uniref:Aminotransferase-like plant mobile domain-containing protein n=1 Tax=Gossypium stocksii TaxID=47602 RepID=A0A9D3WAJ1_9ROSI|nr:hypothetical protein J1N35_003904 [Gossypium stocksii]